MIHWSTGGERIQMVSQVSRTHHGACQTVYCWQAIGRRVLEEARGTLLLMQKPSPAFHTLVLTVVIETHARYRGIHTCVKTMHGMILSVGKVAGIVTDAGHAHGWVERQRHPGMCALALDVHDSSQHGNASLHVVDVQSGARLGHIPASGRGWGKVVSDRGRAMTEAMNQVGGPFSLWYVCHVAAHV